MALSLSQTDAVLKLVKPGMRVCSFGYPDIIAPLELQGLKYREDSEAICRRHGLKSRQIPDANSFFETFGAKLDVYDIVQERGCEILCDLNEENVLFNESENPYDIVLDVGTAEHCFNIAMAMINMAMMVKKDGYIIHENPACQGNHGFFNLNPTFFYDFYTDNGFEVEELRLTTRDGRQYEVPPVQRFKFPAGEFNIFCLAKRFHVKPFVFPTQTKYKPAAVVPGERAASERAIGESNG